METKYNKQAEKFLKETNTEFKAEFLKYGKHFPDDKDKRDIYEITLNRAGREYKFNFGQSIAESGFKLINTHTNKETKYLWFDELTYNKDRNEKKLFKDILNKFHSMNGFKIEFGKIPQAYDVLSCLSIFEGNFIDFCGNFGYNEDSIKASKTFIAVQDETRNLKILFNDEELNKLQEIQ